MKVIRFLSIFFLAVTVARSQVNPTGFQDINFGTPFDSVKIKLMSIESYRNNMSYGYDLIYLNDFILGEKTVTVLLLFNNNLKFYRFEIRCQNYTANYFDTIVKNDVQYLSDILAKKYGPPKNKYTPTFFEIKDGYYSFYWKWWKKRFTIFTAISVNGSKYYASAVVYDDNLAKEQQDFEEKSKQESIDKAVNTF